MDIDSDSVCVLFFLCVCVFPMHRFPEIPCNVDFKYDYDCELGIFYIMHIMEMYMHIVHFSSLFSFCVP